MWCVKKMLICLLVFVFYSCKKVIELDLKNSDIKYVIEGVITNEPGVCKVYISQSKPFYQNNQFAGVSGARVKVSDNGIEISLPESGPGTYQTTSVTGTPGHTYQLSVIINNQQFSAACTMPQPVRLDTLYISAGPFGQFRFATVGYTDPPGSKNNYRFVQY